MEKIRQWLKKALIIGVSLILGAPFFALADTSIAAQYVATSSIDQDAPATSPANYPAQSFIPTVSGTINSIAAGTPGGCGLTVSDGAFSTASFNTENAITGGYRYTGSTFSVSAGSTYYMTWCVNNSPGSFTGTQVDTYTDGDAGHSKIPPSGTFNFTTNTSIGNSLKDWAFSVCTDSDCTLSAPPPPDTDTTTHIHSITPYASSTIATSSAATFGATGYVNVNDFVDGMYLQIKYAPFSANITAKGASPDFEFTTLNIPLTTYGTFDVSTTSSALIVGEYTMQTSIRSPSLLNDALNFLGFGQFATFGIKTATSTTFIAASLAAYDIFVRDSQASLQDYLNSASSTAAACIPSTSFSAGECIYFLFVPQAKPTLEVLTNFKNGFLQYAPWGYVTRFVVIMSGSGTSTLPSWTVPIMLGPAGTTTLTYDMQDMITGGGTLLESVKDPENGLSPRDIIEPFIKLFVAISVLFIIVSDVLGMGHNTGGGTSARARA